VRIELRKTTDPIRRAVAAAFSELDSGLASATDRTTGEDSDARAAGRADAAVVAALRAELHAARVPAVAEGGDDVPRS
jgi:hypothetical protein